MTLIAFGAIGIVALSQLQPDQQWGLVALVTVVMKVTAAATVLG